MPPRCVLLVLVATCVSPSINGKKKTGGVPIFDARKSKGEHISHTAAEHAELVKFLVDLGYAQYATPEFARKMEELGLDSIEDLPHLIDDDADEEPWEELAMPEKHAEKIQEAALKELMRRFLAATPGGSMEQHLENLIDYDHTEIEDLEDLDEDDAEDLGLSMKEIDVLVHWAELHVARTVVTDLLRMYRDRSQPSSEFPFRDAAVYKPLLEAILDAGVTELEDVAHLKSGQVVGLSDADLVKLQSDPRVLETVNKSEL